MKQTCEFRFATENDTALILTFIKALAEYEKMLGEVEATEETLREWIFEKHTAQVFFAVLEGKEIGYALYFYNFSTFTGRGGLYLEDLFLLPEYRGMGFGKQIFKKLAQLALEQGCRRMDWSVLNWNAPSIAFYRSLGAVPMEDWTAYRLTGEALRDLAQR